MGNTGKRPNILLITSDQHHYQYLGATMPRLRTPALDRLCREGVRFGRAYCCNPTCTPSRASILTGMYPSQHGAWSLGTKLFEDVPTLGDMLGREGYFTSLVGKAHFQPLASLPGMESIECQPTLRDLDFWRGFNGPWYGFQKVETARMHTSDSHVGGHYALWMEENGLSNWRDYFNDYPPNEDKARQLRASRHWALPEQFHYNMWTSERTIAHLREAADQDRPFFIWSSFHDPHPPYLVPEPWASMYDPADMEAGRLTPGEHDRNPAHFGKTQEQDHEYWQKVREGEGAVHGAGSHVQDVGELRKDIACYCGMISFMDEHIGRILTELDRRGLSGNTIVLFTTDHGHFLGQHGLNAKAIHHYEDLLRIPFIVRWPGRVPSGAVSPALQNLVDLAPSFLAAAGLEIPGAMTGVNQLEAWVGGASARRWSVTENHHGNRRFHMRSYVNQTHKITVYRGGDDGELFDLDNDPGELRNLWHDPASAGLKGRLLHEFMQATLQSEPERMPRISYA
jgi:arylsulfatase A-like enzyme